MSESIIKLAEERTPEDGVIRLMRWPEGYVLWYHGEIVWKSWTDAASRLTMPSLTEVEKDCMRWPKMAIEAIYAATLVPQMSKKP